MAAIDRLRELRSGNEENKENDSDVSHSGGAEIASHMAMYEPIKRALTIIDTHIVQVNALTAQNKTTANEKDRKEVMQQLEKIMNSTNKHGALIKKQLDTIKAEISLYAEAEGSAKYQMRSNLYQTHIRRFHTVMTECNTAVHGFKQDLQARTRREILIVNKDLPEEEIDKIIESGKAQDMIKEALVSDNLRNVVQVIEERHLSILKLDRQVLEIYELFRDLATMVDLQQESLDIIESCIMKARLTQAWGSESCTKRMSINREHVLDEAACCSCC